MIFAILNISDIWRQTTHQNIHSMKFHFSLRIPGTFMHCQDCLLSLLNIMIYHWLLTFLLVCLFTFMNIHVVQLVWSPPKSWWSIKKKHWEFCFSHYFLYSRGEEKMRKIALTSEMECIIFENWMKFQINPLFLMPMKKIKCVYFSQSEARLLWLPALPF